MKKAVECNSKIFGYMSRKLRNDFVLAVIAFSHPDCELLSSLEDEGTGYLNNALDFQFLYDLHEYLLNKKFEHRGFIQVILAVRNGTCTRKLEGESIECSLSLLNNGSESSAGLLNLILEFAGVPRSLEWQRMILAHKYLDPFLDLICSCANW
jgi:hypothetical protein